MDPTELSASESYRSSISTLKPPCTTTHSAVIGFLPMRFCNLGAAVLALALAYSGWSPLAIILPLIAAPVLNIAQLKLMTWQQRGVLLSLIAIALIASMRLPVWFSLVTLPEIINILALLILSALLLRVYYV